MALPSDLGDTLRVFVYANLPVLANPTNARNIVISNVLTPTTETTPTLVIPPGILLALQTASLNNFADLGLPMDIQQIVTDFFALLPPVSPTSTISTVATTTTTS